MVKTWGIMKVMKDQLRRIWVARALVSAVFIANLTAAVPFVLQPARYAAGFQMSGVPGEVFVRSLGILFLMWNTAYPPVILAPHRQRTLLGVLLTMQIIGLAGETWMVLTLPAGHAALAASGLRFILFDTSGLIALSAAAFLVRKAAPKIGSIKEER